MKALFAVGGDVPFARVVSEHRRLLLPLGALLAINIGVLMLVVLPLRASVQRGGTRAQESSLALAEARAELATAEATRDGQAQATRDLDRFYREVLPADVSAARCASQSASLAVRRSVIAACARKRRPISADCSSLQKT